MKFSDFCSSFYSTTKSKCGIKGKTSQPAVAEFFVGIALGDFAKLSLFSLMICSVSGSRENENRKQNCGRKLRRYMMKLAFQELYPQN